MNAKYLNRMKLRGQPESGYAMAVLLVAMSVMAVMLTVAMPVWNHAARREKEAELVFRGEQYARAIGLFQRKYANTPPPSIDVLIQEKFLRKKFKDPITNLDFVPLPAAGGGVQPGPAPAQGRAGAPTSTGSPTLFGRGPPTATGPAGMPAQAPLRQANPTAGTLGGLSGGGGGGIVGVTSASRAESIRTYKGATHYNEWRFVYAPTTATPGGAVPGAATPGAGAPGTTFPGQRGQPPARRGFPGPVGAPGQPGFPGAPTPTQPGTRGGPFPPNAPGGPFQPAPPGGPFQPATPGTPRRSG
jgi:type II secretory pathway pseudopilin PulG